MLLLVSFYGALRAHVAAVLFLSLYKLVSFPESSSIILLFSFSKPLSFLPKHCKRDLEATNLLDGALEVTDLFIDLSGVPARVCCHNWNQHGLEDDNLRVVDTPAKKRRSKFRKVLEIRATTIEGTNLI
ncbi:hypothetical protein AAZX31_13G053000 [Glycine max]